MARSNLQQNAPAGAAINCGDPRTNEATNLNDIRASLRFLSQKGETLVSAWGPFAETGYAPIVGLKSGEGMTSFLEKTYEIPFEQPCFRPKPSANPDRYALKLKFRFEDGVIFYSNSISQTVENSGAVLRGRVLITLVSSAGTQVLYGARHNGLASDFASEEAFAADTEQEKTVYGTLNSSMTSAPGEYRDSKLRLQFLDVTDTTPTGASAIDEYYVAGGIETYSGLLGINFKLFNDA